MNSYTGRAQSSSLAVDGYHTFVAQWEKHKGKDKPNKKTKVKSIKNPQTGDSNSMLMWYLTMAAAQILMIGLLRLKKKKD